MPRSTIHKAALVGLLSLAGCAASPAGWMRPDGRAIDPGQLTLDQTACQGAVNKAAIEARAPVDSLLMSADPQHTQIFVGCMADRGYLASK